MVEHSTYSWECLKENFDGRTTLTNRSLSNRNIWSGEDSLNSTVLINGVETIQVEPKSNKIWLRNSPDYNILTDYAEDGSY